jgi:hypothetical protein
MTGHLTPPSGEQQLDAIASLAGALDRAGIDHWMFGGWAVDFWVGAVTREHEDIDVMAWRHDYVAIGAALRGAGWRHTPVPDEVVGTRYAWRSAQVEFTFLISGDGGSIVIPLPDQPVVLSTEPLGEARRELEGVRARTIPRELLRAGKAFARKGAAEGAKDRADSEALSKIS